MIRLPSATALLPRVAQAAKSSRSSAKQHSQPRRAQSQAALRMTKSVFATFSPILARYYSTPVVTSAAATAATGSAATTAAAAAISSSTAPAAAPAALSMTSSAATAGTGLWANLHYMKLWMAEPMGFTKIAWAPVAGLSMLMEATQLYTGLPWWAVIATFAVIVRLLLTPVVIRQAVTAAKMERIRPKIDQLRNEMIAEAAKNNQAGQKVSGLAMMGETQVKINALMDAEGVGASTALKNVFAQIVPMALFFITINQMSQPESGLTSLKEGGFAWFTDLTVADPYYIFPALAVVSMFVSIKLNPQPRPMTPVMQGFFALLAAFSFYFTATFPAGVHIYWTAVNIMTIITLAFLRVPSIRQRLGIPLPLADAYKAENNQLFSSPPPSADAAAPASPAAPRPLSKRQQRLQQLQQKQNNQQ